VGEPQEIEKCGFWWWEKTIRRRRSFDDDDDFNKTIFE